MDKHDLPHPDDTDRVSTTEVKLALKHPELTAGWLAERLLLELTQLNSELELLQDRSLKELTQFNFVTIIAACRLSLVDKALSNGVLAQVLRIILTLLPPRTFNALLNNPAAASIVVIIYTKLSLIVGGDEYLLRLVSSLTSSDQAALQFEALRTRANL